MDIPNRPVVVVLHGEDRPPGIGPAGEIAEVRYATGHDLAASLPGADVLFVWDFLSPALAANWPHADALRWVHVAGAGVDRVLFGELAASDVVVTNSRGVFDEPMAEYVLALVLCFAKDLHTTVALQRQRRWRHRETERLDRARALVVGTGPIGRAIGRRLASAGLAVSGIGRTGRAADADLGVIRPFGELHQALGDADYVVLAAPLTPETESMIDSAALARMKPSARLINVGRGALVIEPDLAGALAAFAPRGLAVAGRRCLDAGASTGGFTDVLLRAGAAQVIAVDVGYGQLAWSLRTDERVTVLDRVNVRTLTPGQVGAPPELVTADLSFISLTLVLPALAACAAPEADFVLLVKPQFEVGKGRVGAGGVVRDPALRAEAVTLVASAAVTLGLGVAGVAPSPLPGPSGNVEYFLWLRRGAPPLGNEQLRQVIAEGPD